MAARLDILKTELFFLGHFGALFFKCKVWTVQFFFNLGLL